jgi:hypothetical protein
VHAQYDSAEELEREGSRARRMPLESAVPPPWAGDEARQRPASWPPGALTIITARRARRAGDSLKALNDQGEY